MCARAAINRLSLLVAFASTVLTAGAQKPATASTQDLANAAEACQSEALLKLTSVAPQLESVPALVSAAEPLARQIVRLSGSDPGKQPSLSSQLGGFNQAVVSALVPTCIEETATSTKEAASTTVKSSMLPSAKAKATTAQTNTQTGAPASSDGSTSAVQKVGIPQLLGIAVEDGAITNSVSGTTMTLSTTPYAFAYAFTKDKDQDTQERYEKEFLLTHLGISATFNIASTSNPLQSATRKDVSQWQGKVTFRDTSARSSTVTQLYSCEKWKNGKCVEKGGLEAAADAELAIITSSKLTSEVRKLVPSTQQAYNEAWAGTLKTPVSTAVTAGNAVTDQQIEDVATTLLKALDGNAQYQTALAEVAGDLAEDSGDLSDLIQRFQVDNGKYIDAREKFEADVADLPKGWNADLSFGQNYPTSTTTASSGSSTASTAAFAYASSSSTTSTTPATPATPAYLIAEFDVTCQPKKDSSQQKVPCFPLGKSGTFTGNFSGSLYTNPNPALNETTFRGVTGALQGQWELAANLFKKKAANDNSKMTFSVASNYQRLQENKDQKGKRPDIVLGNLKLEIPISSGVSLPLSFSVANATAQIKETYVKGNFGLSFDLDKLSSLLKANQ